VDIWNGCDIIIILIGATFLVTRKYSADYIDVKASKLMICAGIVGLIKDSNAITDTAFDILSLEALFMVPRYDFNGRSFGIN
jgi:hypothetical protein